MGWIGGEEEGVGGVQSRRGSCSGPSFVRGRPGCERMTRWQDLQRVKVVFVGLRRQSIAHPRFLLRWKRKARRVLVARWR